MLIDIKKLEEYKSEIGSKALRLKELKDMGLNVPDFLVIPAGFLSDNIEASGILKKDKVYLLADEIGKMLKCKKYAVRSCALIEDSKESSLAGQFMTKVNVEKKGLPSAINAVAEQAYEYLNGEISKFSIIVQEFIEADHSGVAFTRSPLGGREMVIESVCGRGEILVGGTCTPEKYEFYWSEVVPGKICLLSDNINDFKKIEKHYNFPQDVEWSIKGKKFYVLQTRPITNISESDYSQILYLDGALSGEENFYYKKTEISEIAPRPKTITLSLLKKIYGKGGPIESVYSKFNIKYEAGDFLKIIGNELYVNKEKELTALFPSKSYFHPKIYCPEIVRLKGFVATFKNTISFNKVSTDNYLLNFKALQERVVIDDSQTDDMEKWLDMFIEDYKIVFETNLLAGISLSNLKQVVEEKEEISLSALLSVGSDYLHEVKKLKLDISEENLVGNSFDIADESFFKKNVQIKNKTENSTKGWIKGLKGEERGKILRVIEKAVAFNYLREHGRMLIVLRINRLRKIIMNIAEKENLVDLRNIYFATLDEVLERKIKEKNLIKKKEEYLSFNDFNLPNIITDRFTSVEYNKTAGVSTGIAVGKLVEINEIRGGEKKILYTKILSPDLVKYFDKIEGVLSESGGLLSHLSIIAREKNIPVVVNFNLKKSKLKIGDKVKINGSRGEVKKVD